MPLAALRLCTRSMCGHVQPCPVHGRAARRDYDQRRGSSAERGYDGRWQKLRLIVLAEEPLCFYCNARGRVVAADTVDHKTPKTRGGTDDRDNLCGACSTCNFSKAGRTAEEFLSQLRISAESVYGR